MNTPISILLGSLLLNTLLFAEAPTTPAPHQHIDPVLVKTTELAGQGKLMSLSAFSEQLKAPRLDKILLPAPSTQPMRGRDIATLASKGQVRVGIRFKCNKCENWHVNLGGGYAIAKDTIVTAFHVLEPGENIRTGDAHVFAVRGENEVIPVKAVLVANKELDALVLRLEATDLTPLPFARDPQVGDPVFCWSDPNGVRNYFSNGIINRFYSRRPSKGADPIFQRINVSTDWAIGSSGSAVLDECGNVVGHVGSISSIMKERKNDNPANTTKDNHPPKAPSTLMNLHEAIPAKSILALIQSQPR